LLIEDAPETYYLTDYYRGYPLVLVRLSRVDRDALSDLLSVSWHLTSAKARNRGRSRRQDESSTMASPYGTGPKLIVRAAGRSRICKMAAG